MAFQGTYPGIYIQELPSSVHTITAAPTSIAVFIGYTHPFKTKEFNKAVQIFSFSDYENAFGGLFSSDFVDTNVPYAVNQFFLNGGAVAYVIGLQPSYQGALLPDIVGATKTIPGSGIKLTALELVDDNHKLSVTLSNPRNIPPDSAPATTADVIVAYGARVETFRGVNIKDPKDPNYIDTRINGISTLVTVAPSGTNYSPPIFNPPAPGQSLTVDLTVTPPASFATTFNALDFIKNALQVEGPLDKIPIFNLLILPGIEDNGILSEALAFCERRQAFLIMDPPRQAVADQNTALSTGLPLMLDEMQGNNGLPAIPASANGAVYFPYLKSEDPLTGQIIELPPSGYVSGIFARTDLNRGVWKAPAGLETTILNTTGVVDRGRLTDNGHGTLNAAGVNCLRTFTGGTVVFGARTLVGATTNTTFEQWRYVPVRRMALIIEQTLLINLRWVIFEPNDTPLWTAITASINAFMLSLFHQGAFQGLTPSQAFQVKCDSTTTTQTDIDNGIVNIVVAFAPLKPAEFVIVKIAQLAGQAQQ